MNDLGTYTYTARNANDPDRVVTFTLDDEYLKVNLTDWMDQASTILQSEEKPSEIKEQIKKQAAPSAAKLMETIAGKVHVSDVRANLDDAHLTVTLWQRAGGLRLSPMRLNMGNVDNVDAAESFLNEIEIRKQETQHTSKFFGPLDYWFGWAALIFVVALLLRWPGDRGN